MEMIIIELITYPINNNNNFNILKIFLKPFENKQIYQLKPFNTLTGSAVVDIMNERILLLLKTNINNSHKKSQSRRNKFFQSLSISSKSDKCSVRNLGDSPRSSGSQSASSASTIRENDQVLKVKYISLEKQLFKKEEEKRELLEQLELGKKRGSTLVSKQTDEFEDKAEQINLLQRNSLKAVASNSSKSNVGSSNAGANSSPIISLNTSEEINGNRIKEIEYEFESYRIAKENLAMETVIRKPKK
ncbi:hypothetical protein DICPUDRAFT_85458 [Dictyostelium purpureum]|uniref:Uncharacterized protein n=1 Tax=Dictyostelium purpureum TaxID=5786 RepID=F1A5S9_DICPU|nr:uncharacterized protein DICPUDRAFT_85458 [Dictyostelium purpureum]EGC28452.1 hypothetical protein DICPUDRAFT_85458 [Dictyostelium purpureum]|eukprot:XP_003295023.1 hypothetical protein DICPUDRAFT_85458 [Dictyostelium purpureum]